MAMSEQHHFQQKQAYFGRVMEEIKALAYLWIKNRSKASDLTWDRWLKFDLEGLGV
ncbi:hypothetical protein Hanom_Chr02g00174121 [Helianthus anomalus]